MVFQPTKVDRDIEMKETHHLAYHRGGEDIDENIDERTSYAAVEVPDWRREGCIVRAVGPEKWKEGDG